MTTGIGSILIAGLASLLICIFLGPKFIEEARTREFGQMIREEGPEGHHTKAGTPTMGGIIIFAAISIPFLILSSYDWRSVGRPARCTATHHRPSEIPTVTSSFVRPRRPSDRRLMIFV